MYSNIYIKLLIISSMALVLMASSCKDEPPVPSPNPEIIVEQGMGLGTGKTEYREVEKHPLTSRTARIFCSHEMESYYWQFGQDPTVYDTDTVELVFPDAQDYSKGVNLNFRGVKDGDTTILVKTIYPIPLDSSLVIGTFKGVFIDTPSDTVQVTVYAAPPFFDEVKVDVPSIPCREIYEVGVTGESFHIQKALSSDSNAGYCTRISGNGRINLADSIELTFKMDYDQLKLPVDPEVGAEYLHPQRTFIGIKQ